MIDSLHIYTQARSRFTYLLKYLLRICQSDLIRQTEGDKKSHDVFRTRDVCCLSVVNVLDDDHDLFARFYQLLNAFNHDEQA